MKHLKGFELFESKKINAIRQFIPYETFYKDPKTGEYDKTKRIRGRSKIIGYAGRKIVIFDVNGLSVPFYLSSGHGGKKDVPSGKWYPFFGIGPDGWFNKLSGTHITSYYDVPLLKSLAEELDRTIGDIREDSTVPVTTVKGDHLDAINKDLNPTENQRPTTLKNFNQNLQEFKEKLKKVTQ